MAETAKAGSGSVVAGGGSAGDYERHGGKDGHHSRRGGGGGGRGGRQRRDGKRGGGGGGFDPHAAIAPKILVKRPVLLPDTPTELSQPSPSQQQPMTERTLFVPTLSSSSSAAAIAAAATASSSSFAATGRRDQRVHPSVPHPPPRQPSPGVSIAAAPALSTLSSPMRLLSPSFRLAGLEQLERLLSDQAAPFTVISAVGLQQAGKSSLLNAMMLRSGEGGGAGFAVGSKEGAGGSGGKAGQQQHGTQGVEIVVSPERVLYLDTQPLLSQPPPAGSHREEAGNGSAFLAAVSAEMFDLQMPLLLLSLSHVLLLTVTWPIPQQLVAHLRTVFALYAVLAPSLQPAPPPPPSSAAASLPSSLPPGRCAEVVLVINKLSESSADSPQAIHSAVSSLFPSAPFPLSGAVGNGGGGAGAGRLNLFVLPWRERGSLHESSTRELRTQLLAMRKDGGGGGVRGSERDWLRRLQTAWSCIAHSPLVREERRRIERKTAALHAPPPAFSISSAAASSSLQQQQYGQAGGQQQQQARRLGVARGDAADDLYHRDAPPSSHHYRLYQPPG